MTGKNSAVIFLISFALAGLLLVLFIACFPLGGKLKLSLISSLPKNPKEIEVYQDIDHDDNSEHFRFFKDLGGSASAIPEQNGAILHQWNLNGKFAQGDFYCTGDCNADGYSLADTLRVICKS
ncbi:MAG: hypothetical protein AB2L20_25890 [Mangrovibacterium sp.]